MTRLLIFALIASGLYCCQTGQTSDSDPKKKPAASASKVPQAFANDIGRFPNNEGPIGVFPVEEMLMLSIIDSAAMQDVQLRTAHNYTLLEADMMEIGAEANGPLGQISYNNDPDNFKFECLIPIRQIPAKEPRHSQIVILEATRMLIYNHYGPYQDLYRSYDKIRSYCKSKGLEQSGPVREFYITDPTVEPDQSKWITRIMLPVIEKR